MPPRHSLDVTLEILVTRTRRQILTALGDRDPEEAIVVSSLVPRMGGGYESRIELRHVHLPLLDEHGFIEWEETTDEIRQGPRFSEVEPFLEIAGNLRATL